MMPMRRWRLGPDACFTAAASRMRRTCGRAGCRWLARWWRLWHWRGEVGASYIRFPYFVAILSEKRSSVAPCATARMEGTCAAGAYLAVLGGHGWARYPA